MEFAQALAKRVMKESPASGTREQLDYAFLLAMGRNPNQKERARLQEFLDRQRKLYLADAGAAAQLVSAESTSKAANVSDLAAWTSLCRVLFNLDDFMTRE
jgi:hypothetical protein